MYKSQLKISRMLLFVHTFCTYLKEQLIRFLNNNFIRKQLRWTDENHKDVINNAVYRKLFENSTILK